MPEWTAPGWLMPAISNYGYAALFLAALVEGPIATVLGAMLASQGLLHVGGVYTVAVAGDLTGDIILYGLGMSGRVTVSPLNRRFKRMGGRQFGALMTRFRRYPGRVLVTAKLTHAAGFVVLFGAGVARIPLRLFIGFNLLATLPKSGVLVLVGYFAGAAWHRVNAWLWVFSCSLLLALGVALVICLRKVTGSVLSGR
ncbi:DedA family protein [Martelella alba]|uniref:Membrane protein DedA with SNARE-associated domain n=1 Tax=Martelella alba TaxID=2590451 RepID=A0ABY2SH56_9HYPH|nr:hypothetical protein [Martelella alba]TKI04598.1 hypothetical protein FCN80_17435 [Martelella alba]